MLTFSVFVLFFVFCLFVSVDNYDRLADFTIFMQGMCGSAWGATILRRQTNLSLTSTQDIYHGLTFTMNDSRS